MRKEVAIEDAGGDITTGYTCKDVAEGDIATITARDENGREFEATGKVVDIA